MNFKIDIDMTPEELRKVLGLPDVQKFQEEMMQKMKEQIEAGAEGYDLQAFFKPYLYGNTGSMEAMQKLMMGLMTSVLNGSTPSSSDKTSENKK